MTGLVARVVALGLVASACTGTGPRAGPTEPSPGIPSAIIDTSEIVDGGPPPDGIPPIDYPEFVSPDDADSFLVDAEPVIALDIAGDARAYPARILIWHEIVNDEVGGVPVSVTYCPLCNTGIVFRRPVIDGELLDFGTSGKLYRSNLVMYDRQTGSLWPQALGVAAQGPLLGTELELVPAQLVSWGDFKQAHPDGRVLSIETGFSRDYGINPYAGYDRPTSAPFLFGGELDPRLPPKARVVGVRVGEDVIAFPYTEITTGAAGDWSIVDAEVGGRPVVVFWKDGATSAVDAARIARSRVVGATGVFDPRLDGRTLSFDATERGIVDGETGSTWDLFGRAVDGPLAGRALDRVVSIESFWFDWAAIFPDTRIWRRR
jgi:hypothetical protein